MELSSLRSFRRKQVLKLVVPVGSLVVLLLKMGFFCEIRGCGIVSNPGGKTALLLRFLGGLLTKPELS